MGALLVVPVAEQVYDAVVVVAQVHFDIALADAVDFVAAVAVKERVSVK